MADSAGTSAAICGVWVDDDDGAGRAISQYIWSRSNQKQEVTRADLETSFLKDDKNCDKYFVLMSMKSLENHNFLLFITRVLCHLHYLKRVSKLVLVLVDKNLDEKKHMNNYYLQFFDKVQAVPDDNTSAGTFIDEEDLEEIYMKLSENEIEIKDFLPIGNVGIGLAWSYFYGFLNINLPEITSNIDSSEHYKNSTRMSRKFFIIIPKSGKTPERFCDIDPRFITEALKDKGIEQSRAGKPRRYMNYVHEIKHKNPKEKYVFCGEFATPVLVLRKMLDEGEINEEELERQLRFFRLTLKFIVNHPRTPDSCKGKTEIVTFADQDSTFSLADQLQEEISSNTDDSLMEYETEGSDVMTIISGQDEDGIHWAKQIKELFKGTYSKIENATFGHLQQKTVDRTVVDKQFHKEEVDNDKLIIILTEDFKDEVEKHVFPLIFNTIWFPRTTFIVKLGDVPPWLKHSGADYIDKSEDNIKERILGGAPYQAALLPVRNVAEGFAWSYHHNYLALLGPDIADRIKMKEYYSQKIMPSKWFILLPWSCLCHPSLTEADKNITFARNLDPKTIQIAGNDRTYETQIHKISSQGHTYYACVEYCTPVQTMYEMEDKDTARLSPDQMMAELFVFRKLLQEMISKSEYKQHIELICYDDHHPSKSLSAILMENIIRCL